LQGIPIGSINSIRNLDKDQQRLRPLRSLQDDSLDIVDSTTQLPANYRLRTHHAQEQGLEDAELDLMMSRLDTGSDGEEDERFDDDDGDDSVEEVIGSQYGTRDGMRHYSNDVNDMEMEDIVVQNGGSRIVELPESASTPSVKTRRRQDEEELQENGGSPVPQLQVGPGLQ
jgi:hypothetical protein